MINLNNPKNYFLLGSLQDEEGFVVYSREKRMVLDDATEEEVLVLMKAGAKVYENMEALVLEHPNKVTVGDSLPEKPFDAEMYEKWKKDEYFFTKGFGYWKGLVAGFKFYYTEEHVLAEYMKQKRFLETDGAYRKFRGDYYKKYY